MSFVPTRPFASSRRLSAVSRAAIVLATLGLVTLGAAACSEGSTDNGGSGPGTGGVATGGTTTTGGTTAAGGTGGIATGGTTAAGGTGGAATGGAATGGAATGGSGSALVNDGSGLDSVYFDYFPVGVALQQSELEPDLELIGENFNHLTAGNAMKGSSIHPAENTWNTTEADYLADFARTHGWKMTGHTLVWHRQQASWMFEGLTAGDAGSIETLKGRLKAHIDYMVGRYGDVVDNWDVVNEVVLSNTADDYRKTDNRWYEIFQSIDYVYWAFRYTKEALEAQAPGSSVGKLYYNDYNINQKADGVLALCAWLENHPEGGIHVDGIGEQAHWRIDWPGTAELESLIEKLSAAGHLVKISELDVNVYNDYPAPDYSFVAAPQVAFDTTLDGDLATRYKDLFAMLRRQAPKLTSVTFWGFRDEDSWLNNEPVSGRANYPLLFNAAGPKAAYTAIQEF